ncbi:fatty acid desaturase [Hufsiella ginkgonis]|uniref:Fatty acid desaturase n=1 Tax=Hufsiella ginkgonis TaxID=2695274 RepID=A0A7K1XVC2_9SPHI|nr:fatty acid desaturase [Hufsiella ginkgonis]MXV14747.1 fatty acid desaturase [Hufsiella ginkgonis]
MKYQGLLIATLLVSTWAFSLAFLLTRDFSWTDPLVYAAVLIQAHLYTGLFITAHDAMHGTVSSNRAINSFTGQLCTLLYALFPYRKLYRKHHEHHRYVHTGDDPDHHPGKFWPWYAGFIASYISWWQIAAMAVLFNLLKVWFPEKNLLLFWVLPSLLSTLQLFYFGTWLPHHGEHENKHHSRTQRKNHLAAFLSCYFFGYHLEHHEQPAVPWWQLWKLKA